MFHERWTCQRNPLFLFSPHIRESRAYRRTYTDVGYEGFFNREIIGESVKPPRSLASDSLFFLSSLQRNALGVGFFCPF